MATVIKPKRSETSSSTPGTSDIEVGEIAVNITDQKIFIRKSDDNIIELANASGIGDVVDDTSPQLGGNWDVNGNDIVSVSNGNISLLPNGTGKVVIDGNGSSGGVSIDDGNIDIRTGTGSVSKIKFYCESSNAHAQTLQAAPHSESASNTLTLPSTGGDARLVSTTSTATLTNKTLTRETRFVTAARMCF
mgnify:CR=1 FL=1